ncbi:MAG: 50S ribosomal protein L3, partial [Deltaproteobacteria bacterium]|nr:50S ribosomal protein L3 [Deltaproteobacteria bacterium]
AKFEVGAEINAELFEAGQKVDVIGISKGRGNAGVIKRFNFKINRKTHGTHEGTRRPGSIGAGAYPGKVTRGSRPATSRWFRSIPRRTSCSSAAVCLATTTPSSASAPPPLPSVRRGSEAAWSRGRAGPRLRHGALRPQGQLPPARQA